MRIRKLLSNTYKVSIIVSIIIGVYFAGILWFTLLNREPAYKLSILPPFFSYKLMVSGDVIALKENLLNILLFVPLGLLYEMIFHQGIKKSFFLGLFVALIIEFTQLITTLGTFEFDDLLHNSFGSLLGSLLFAKFSSTARLRIAVPKKIVLYSTAISTIVLCCYNPVYHLVTYNRMKELASMNDIAGYQNILVLDGKDGYAWNTKVYVKYLKDGSLSIKGNADRRSWYQIGEIILEPGEYMFAGLSDVEPKTVALSLEFYDRKIHKYYQTIDDLGPSSEISFTLDRKTKIRAYVSVYEGINCDVIARPALYKKE